MPSKPRLTDPLTLADETYHLAEVVFAVAAVLDIVDLQHFFLTQQACHLGTKQRGQIEKGVATNYSLGPWLGQSQDPPRKALP